MSRDQDEIRYQVFVSSTFTDLKEEREKVLQAILECKAFPAGMELFPAADDEQFEFIKREIDSSDYYIVIIAGRYGTLAPDGVSFTEKEFDYALVQKKPILAFLHINPGQIVGDKLDLDKELRLRLDAFRKKAGTSRLIKHYENPDNLRAQVLAALHAQFDLKPMRGWVRAGQTPREQLERIADLQQRVIGLEEENKLLRESTDNASELLAKGTDAVDWDLTFDDFYQGYMQEQEGCEACILRMRCTWDDILTAVFPGGTSITQIRSLPSRLLGLAFAHSEADKSNTELKKQLKKVIEGGGDASRLKAVEFMKSQTHRQFTGLGYITEEIEVVYERSGFRSAAAGPEPVNRRTWRLTSKGETYMAMLHGERRSCD